MIRDALVASLLEWGRQTVELAQHQILDELAEAVPYRDGTLADSLEIRSAEGPSTMGFEVTYPTDVANFTEYGTGEHDIDGPLHFYWEKIGMWVIVPARPIGNGVGAFVNDDDMLVIKKGFVHIPEIHKNDGWFSKVVNEDHWRDVLQQAADSTELPSA